MRVRPSRLLMRYSAMKMRLALGDRLGPYEIVAPAGAGGLGEVYKARDTRLDRSVAIKVLPEHIARREDLRQRFEYEARAVGSLNHPNICTLHDIGSQNGTGYIVMEYLDGETLASRLSKGPLPLNEVMKIAGQVADALERAHRASVIHRDVKPGNIMLTRDGVKLLDFGLAKSTNIPGRSEETLTLALTAEGTIVGTPQYMAPEQLQGKDSDARSDVFAFGCVLYEMLTGQRAFEGKTPASIIAKILESEPPGLRALQPAIPQAVADVVETCLSKEPDARWQSAADVKRALELSVRQPGVAGVKQVRWIWPVALVSAALVSAGLVWFATRPEPVRRLEFAINPPPAAEFRPAGTNEGNSAISPDGTTLAFSARTNGVLRIWIRRLDSITPRSIPGTEGGYYPFWAPDSRHLAFFVRETLRRTDVDGAAVQTLWEGQGGDGRGGAWNADGVILFVPGGLGIMRTPAAGGKAVQVTRLAPGETAHYWPTFLPDNRHFLYVVRSANRDETGIYVTSLESPERRKRLSDAPSNAAYSPPALGSRVQRANGYLIYPRQRLLLAQPFDLDKLELRDEPVPIAKDVTYAGNIFLSDFSVSQTGVLAHASGGGEDSRHIVWRDRFGKEIPSTAFGPRSVGPRISPDLTRVAFIRFDRGAGQSWIVDLARGTSRPVAGDRDTPVWGPRGSFVVFRKADGIFRQSDSGAGEVVKIYNDASFQPIDLSPDGRYLLLWKPNRETSWDLHVLDIETGQNAPYAATPLVEADGRFSPDGRWVAYLEQRSGTTYGWVQPFVPGRPAPGVRWKISEDEAFALSWRDDGKELYYRTAGMMKAVSVHATGDSLSLGPPVKLFDCPAAVLESRIDTRDGQRFLVVERAETTSEPMTIVLNWQVALRR